MINKKYRYLTPKEKYSLGYMEGRRTGLIETVRSSLINYLKKLEKKQGFNLSKNLIQKINLETDSDFLLELFSNIYNNHFSVKEIEDNYNRLFLVPAEDPEKDKNLKNLFIFPEKTNKENENENNTIEHYDIISC